MDIFEIYSHDDFVKSDVLKHDDLHFFGLKFHNLHNFDDAKIDQETFLRFLTIVKKKYKQNPYHNFYHAIDVTISLSYFMMLTQLDFNIYDKVGLIVGMLCHDVGHFGKTNAYVRSTDEEFVLKYGNSSPLERYHLALTKSIIEESGLLDNLETHHRRNVHDVIDCVILHTNPEGTKRFLNTIDHTIDYTIDHAITNIVDDIDAMLLLSRKNMIYALLAKCADVTSTIKSFDVHKQWAHFIGLEFELLEHPLECPTSFDQTFCKTQCMFFEHYVIPLFEMTNRVFDNKFHNVVESAMSNYTIWKNMYDDVTPIV
jgi:hypothetical protein